MRRFESIREIIVGSCEGKVALVTGASRGIGKAIAMRFASEGAAVVLNASRMGEHKGLVGTLEESTMAIQAAGGKAAAIACDLTDGTARANLVERASEPFGPVDIVVNNADLRRLCGRNGNPAQLEIGSDSVRGRFVAQGRPAILEHTCPEFEHADGDGLGCRGLLYACGDFNAGVVRGRHRLTQT